MYVYVILPNWIIKMLAYESDLIKGALNGSITKIKVTE